MATRRLSELKRFISDALQTSLREQEQSADPADPIRLGPPWPYVGEDKISCKVSRGQSTPEKSQRQLVRRLKRFQYPYPQGNKSHKTFYDHVKSMGLLDFLVYPPFLWEIRRAWFFRRHYDLEKKLRDEKKSQYGYPLEFHRRMMLEISGHLGRMLKIAREHGVPKKWFADDYAAMQKQLLREAAVCYPELRRWCRPTSRIRPHSLAVGARLDIFDAIQAEFTKIKMDNNKLAYQLTALICSSQSCVRTGILDPSPETIRRTIRDKKKKAEKIRMVKKRTEPI